MPVKSIYTCFPFESAQAREGRNVEIIIYPQQTDASIRQLYRHPIRHGDLQRHAIIQHRKKPMHNREQSTLFHDVF